VARPVNEERRRELIARLADHVTQNGFHSQTVSTFASSADLSPRMLIHYFGTMDALRMEVVREVGARLRREMTTLSSAEVHSPRAFVQAMVRRMSRPDFRGVMGVFFELINQAAEHPEIYGDIAGQSSAVYQPTLVALLKSWGAPADRQAALATLMLGMARGLTLDLLASDDLERVQASADLFGDMLAREIAHGTESNAERVESLDVPDALSIERRR